MRKNWDCAHNLLIKGLQIHFSFQNQTHQNDFHQLAQFRRQLFQEKEEKSENLICIFDVQSENQIKLFLFL